MSPSRAGHLLLAVNSAWNVANFRAGLVRALVAAGYRVTVAAPQDESSDRIAALGARFVDLPMQPHGRSPSADLALLGRYVTLMRRERFDAFLGYTAKPNIYGSLAAALCRVPAINNVAGLGQVFNERGATNRLLRGLYRVALRRSARVFFQNADDRDLFVRDKLVPVSASELLPGSGVDLDRFHPAADPPTTPFVFLLPARLLWEKGIAELIAAARTVRAAHPAAEVRLLGFVERGKPAFVQAGDLAAWEREGVATYLGTAQDVRPHFAAAHCIVLPSFYPEGTPRALLEGAAMARPLITCDMPGCRDVVTDGDNGFLVPPRDVPALAARMLELIRMPPERRAAMGARSRAIAESRFAERFVIDRYLAALDRVTASPVGASE